MVYKEFVKLTLWKLKALCIDLRNNYLKSNIFKINTIAYENMNVKSQNDKSEHGQKFYSLLPSYSLNEPHAYLNKMLEICFLWIHFKDFTENIIAVT